MQPDKMTPENNVHPVPPVKSDDYEILRKIEEDGSIAYYHPTGSTVKTQTEELSMVLGKIFERMDTLACLMTSLDEYNGGPSVGNVGYLLEHLSACAKRQIHEITEFMYDSIGNIEVDIVSPEDDGIYRSGRVVGLNLTPSEKWKERQADAPQKK
ncbi:MAG: hypothetical protein NTV58_06350 [Deltaproteobacteria bacterium]|nr:hypothetical protein [Deltaproteobacteria bacterium]